MHIRDVIDEGIRYLLVGDVDPDTFDPSRGTEPVEIGLMSDRSRLCIVPIIAEITAATEQELITRARLAIRDHQARYDGVVRLFGPIPAYAIIERSRSGHLVRSLDADGNPRGPAREIAWLGAVTVTPLRADIEAR